MTDLLALAERCEQATGADRALDLAIAVAVNRDDIFDAHYEWRWGLGGDEIEAWEPDKRKPSGYLDPAQFCHRVTASLDAAMQLVPEGVVWGAGSWGNPNTDGPWAWCATKQQSQDNDLDYGKAATPALALCAAALRARAA